MKAYFLSIAACAAFTAAGQIAAERFVVQPGKADQTAVLSFEPAFSRQTQFGPEPQRSAKDFHIHSREKSERATQAQPASWQVITQSMNVYGVVESSSKPLQYNDELNAVSFVHRKGPYYVANPVPSSNGAETGVILGVFTQDWGTVWDTTLLWNNDTYWARYPQGAIYNPLCNEDISKAYLVASGPVTGAPGGWQGSFLASKQLDMIGGPGNTDTMSTNLNASGFFANTGTFPSGKFDTPIFDFTVTDDGRVRTLGYLVSDVNGTGPAFGWQGASIIQGIFVSGGFSWIADTIIPDIYQNSAGTQYVTGVPRMAWNESGTVGFVWFTGVRTPRIGQGDTLSNMGYQPIVYKTVNSGATWTEISRIDFNDAAFQPVMDQLLAVQGDSMGIPFFNSNEGMAGIVDRNDRLHIASTVVGTFSKHPDSLNYFYVLTHADGEQYRFGHRPGLRPFIFDFSETPTGWQVTLVDSMSTEAPGTSPGDAGVNDNPWDVGGASGTEKVESGARLQLSRTPDGSHIIYTWAESDTGYTFSSHKWNALPNIIARMSAVSAENGSTPGSVLVHPTEINITNPANNSLPPFTISNQVANKAAMHFISPTMAKIGTNSFGVPVTVSNNSFVPIKQASTINHYYLPAALQFDSNDQLTWPVSTKPCTVITITEKSVGPSGIAVFPNPASGLFKVQFITAPAQVELQLYTLSGKLVMHYQADHEPGEKDLEVDISSLERGLYFLTVETPDQKSTHKIIVE